MSIFTQGPPWFRAASLEIGVREEPENSGPAIRRYIAMALCGHEGDPWCAIFANAMFESVGIHGTRSASSQSFAHDEHFRPLSGPALGAVTVFWRKSRHSGVGHVGFYRGESANYVYVLGGNEGDMVQIEPLPKASATFGLVGYFWPQSVAIPQALAIPMPAGAPAVTKVT